MRTQVEVINCDRCKEEIEDHEKTYHGITWDKDVKEQPLDLEYAKERNLGDLCARCFCIKVVAFRDRVLQTNKLTLEDLEDDPALNKKKDKEK